MNDPLLKRGSFLQRRIPLMSLIFCKAKASVRKMPVLVMLLVLIMLALLIFTQDVVKPLLRFSRPEILEGQLWRILTGHLVHTNVAHGVMNMVALVLIFLLVGARFTLWRWAFTAIVLAFSTSLLLFLFSPEVYWYVGLSGLLHGLLALGLAEALIKQRDAVHAVALLLLGVKVVREQLPGVDMQHVSTLIEAPVVVDAHFYGALGGLVLVFIWRAMDALLLRYKCRR